MKIKCMQGFKLTFKMRFAYNFSIQMADSASRHNLSMVRVHSTGYLPFALSPDNMTQSAPSMIALTTSDDSALVARGLNVIDSNICVAQIPGLPALKIYKNNIIIANKMK